VTPTPPLPSPPKSRANAALVGLALVAAGAVAWRAYSPRFVAVPTERAVAYKVDLNAAGENELAQVPNVGPKTAAAIVKHREEHGPFASVDELTRVKGIGAKTLEKVGPYFAVSGGAAEKIEPVVLEKKPAAPPPTSTSRDKLKPGDPPIDVNAATLEELQRIPRIGPGTAAKIVAVRTEKPFASVDDLRRVAGIGVKTLDAIRPYVTVKPVDKEK
jgi:competence protein ComEA